LTATGVGPAVDPASIEPMIISGAIALDPSSHAATTASVRERLEQLEERRRTAELSVDRVLAAWRGEAADHFRGRWTEWNDGASSVIDQLSLAADALDQVRRDLASADRSSGQATARLAGRLG
jgi:WXG100 family type VII secretion target